MSFNGVTDKQKVWLPNSKRRQLIVGGTTGATDTNGGINGGTPSTNWLSAGVDVVQGDAQAAFTSSDFVTVVANAGATPNSGPSSPAGTGPWTGSSSRTMVPGNCTVEFAGNYGTSTALLSALVEHTGPYAWGIRFGGDLTSLSNIPKVLLGDAGGTKGTSPEITNNSAFIVPAPCKLTAVTWDIQVASAGATLEVIKNESTVIDTISLSTAQGVNTSSIQLAAGDSISLRTGVGGSPTQDSAFQVYFDAPGFILGFASENTVTAGQYFQAPHDYNGSGPYASGNDFTKVVCPINSVIRRYSGTTDIFDAKFNLYINETLVDTITAGTQGNSTANPTIVEAQNEIFVRAGDIIELQVATDSPANPVKPCIFIHMYEARTS